MHLDPSSRIPSPGLRAGGLALAAVLALAGHATAQPYAATTLVDGVCCGPENFDPNLVQAWGVAMGRAGPAWVTVPKTGKATLYNGSGVPQALVVQMQPLPGAENSTPTGIVSNRTTDFLVSNGAGARLPASFLFATEAGTITGWAPAAAPSPQNTTAVIAVDRSGADGQPEARYTGLAIASTPDGTRLYAADLRNGRIDVFDGAFAPVALNLTDPNLPAGLAPYNVRVLDGEVYVAYARPDPQGDVIRGVAQGVVDVYRTDGTLRRRIATGGRLNAPWGMAIAPANFGELAGALLVANTGDGKINGWDPKTGAPLLPILDRAENPIVIDGLRGIEFGNGVLALNQPTNALFFTASPDAAAGLVGRIDQACPADVDGSGVIDPADVARLIVIWGKSLQEGTLAGDFDGDGAVVPADIARFVSVWLAALAGGC